MIVPSHFIPLAAPGMIAKGMRWMFDSESPFYIKPRMNLDLLRWGWLFIRHANRQHVLGSRGLLRDLGLESRRLFTELAADSPLCTKGPEVNINYQAKINCFGDQIENSVDYH